MVKIYVHYEIEEPEFTMPVCSSSVRAACRRVMHVAHASIHRECAAAAARDGAASHSLCR